MYALSDVTRLVQKKNIATGSSPPMGYIIHGTSWLDFLQRLEDFHLVFKHNFAVQGHHNQTALSRELVERLSEHQITVPAHEADDQDTRFVLCQYQLKRAPSSRRQGYEHRISRDDNATPDDWTLRALLSRSPDLKHRGLPMMVVGMFLSPIAMPFLIESRSISASSW
jgi:hypothetical protein